MLCGSYTRYDRSVMGAAAVRVSWWRCRPALQRELANLHIQNNPKDLQWKRELENHNKQKRINIYLFVGHSDVDMACRQEWENGSNGLKHYGVLPPPPAILSPLLKSKSTTSCSYFSIQPEVVVLKITCPFRDEVKRLSHTRRALWAAIIFQPPTLWQTGVAAVSQRVIVPVIHPLTVINSPVGAQHGLHCPDMPSRHTTLTWHFPIARLGDTPAHYSLWFRNKNPSRPEIVTLFYLTVISTVATVTTLFLNVISKQ